MIWIEILLSFAGVIGFAILFSAPPRHWPACGLTGALAWGIYAAASDAGMNEMLAVVLAGVVLTLAARIIAIVMKAPATIYLVCGIFPLVPGASIYYTAYYLITNSFSEAAVWGTETLKTALAIAIGIILGSSLPQSFLHGLVRLCRRKEKKS